MGALSVCGTIGNVSDYMATDASDAMYTLLSYAPGLQSSSSKGVRPKGTTDEFKQKCEQDLVEAKNYCAEAFALLKNKHKKRGHNTVRRGLYRHVIVKASEGFFNVSIVSLVSSVSLKVETLRTRTKKGRKEDRQNVAILVPCLQWLLLRLIFSRSG
jgi:hypothetical protein